MSTVTAEFLRKFKPGDLVDLKVTRGRWTGPFKLTVYKIDPPAKDAKAAAYMEIGIGEKEPFKRWLIAEDQQIIRAPVAKEQKARAKVQRVK